ncbi:Response regulator receiver domain-containing protein [Paucidesulfovibrio gracilis DSM 16080]|uniref:Response regulator receiver domain-containing protein n=1 Tax=Paucidesulfovibrio gracilis DSM 16080 TaxID=1121449 RepID=A0A1T4Y3Q9_9BACT|nr:response regulator [Paucidesulfovibrio gracilis]SKA96457.1 Response regulator receiver domain-containing protein [Paucidesulfovibrio gracilis DSM 16080]
MNRNEIMILIVDRNPHVREFLGREFRSRGFGICAAGSAEAMRCRLASSTRPDLVILDPDLPPYGEDALLGELCSAHPDLPLVLHGHGVGDYSCPGPGVIELVEKSGRTDALGAAVDRALWRASRRTDAL